MDDVTVLVGEKLSLLVEATDPDSGDLTFFADGKPERAQFVAGSDGKTALFTWIPEVTDSAPGGKEHEVVFTAEDENGAWDSETVVITVLPQWAPQFVNPPGYVLDLAEKEQIEFMVEVKDDSASHVAITMKSGPPNAFLEQSEKKRAYFSWRPTEDQIASKLFWYVTFTASGYVQDPAVPGQETLLYSIEHNIIIVIINADFKGCPGVAPIISHAPVSDLHESGDVPLSGYPVTAVISDPDSFVAQANVFWTSAAPESAGSFQALSMDADAGNQFTVVLPKLSASAGLMLHYYIEAVDNDDYAGTACDHMSRVPKQGYYSMAVYGPGFDSACLDDPQEDNDSLQSAGTILPGTYPGLRVCGQDHDYYRIDANSPQVTVSVEAYGASESLAVDVLDGNGGPVHGQMTGSTSFSFPGTGLAGGQAVLHFYSTSGAPATYTLTVVLQDQQCAPDSLEPSDSVASAPLIGEGEFNNLSICAGDLDYYRIEVPAGNVLSVLADFAVANGDLDLLLLGSGGQETLAVAQTSGDDELIELTAPTGGTYYVQVSGAAGASNSYNLLVTVSAPTEQCLDDSFSPNGYPEMAAMVPVGTYDGLVACPNKEDWFAIGLNGGETLTVKAKATSGALSMELFTAETFTIVCASTPASGGPEMQCNIPGAGFYLFSVSGAVAVPAAYSLEVAVSEDTSVCKDDRFESNDFPDQATAISYPVTTWVKACGQDADWFSFEAYPLEEVVAAVGYAPQAGPVDLSLYGPGGSNLLAVTNSGAGINYVQHVISDQGTYYLMIKGGDFFGNVPYDLFLWIQ